MDFSDVLEGQRARFSPNCQFLATLDKYIVTIRDADSLEVVRTISCLDQVSAVSWSPDSQFLLCGQYKRRIVQVWSLTDSDWTCKIDEGLAGLAHAAFSPDSRHILTTTDYNLRTTIWSLVKKSVYYIKFPKFAGKGCEFSVDGKYFAVLERKQFKDYIGIYHCQTWELIKHFLVESEDAVEIKWSPDGRCICVADSCLDYNILIYTPDGRKLLKYSAYDHTLGVRTFAFSPSAQFLHVGSYDEVGRIFSNLTWKCLGEYEHKSTVSTVNNNTVVYTERLQSEVHREKDGEGGRGKKDFSKLSLRDANATVYVVEDQPQVELKQVRSR